MDSNSPKIVTLSGDILDFSDPMSLSALSLYDVLWLLSREKRFGNRIDMDVLRHSIYVGFLCEELCPDDVETIIYGYFHDIQEAFVRDVPTPFKKMVGKAWYDMEETIQSALFTRFNIPQNINSSAYDQFKFADNLACYMEAKYFCPEASPLWEDIPEYTFTTDVIILASKLLEIVVSLDVVDEETGQLSDNTVSLFSEVLARRYQ